MHRRALNQETFVVRNAAYGRRSGFTLLEVLIVMVIGAIAIMMAAPSIGSTVRQTHAQQSAATIAQDLQRGLSLATRTRHPIQLIIDEANKSYQLIDRVDGTVYATQHFGDDTDFALTAMDAAPVQVDMLPNGTVSEQLIVTIQAADNRRQILMTRAGMVRVTAL